jgi:hypothetical protein
LSGGTRRGRGLIILIGLLVVADGGLIAALAFRSRARSNAISLDGLHNDRGTSVFGTLEQSGLPAALDSLEHLAATDGIVLREGHQLAHALGRQALTSSRGDPTILGQCRPTFASGCYHGVVEALLKLRGRVDMAELRRLCEAVGGPVATGPVYECVHGVGHGVFGAVGLDVGAALSHCDSLTASSFVISCHQGVFMEAISSALTEHHEHVLHSHGSEKARFTIDPADPYSPCARYADPYAASCWLFQAFVILRGVDFDAQRALGICDAAPRGRADRCYESVGHQLAGLFQRSDAWVIAQCGKGRPERAQRCAAGAALALVSMDWSGERVTRYCASLPSDWLKLCSETAAQALALVS